MITGFNTAKKIVSYILEDMRTIIEDGISGNIDDFPMTKVMSKYLDSNKFDVTIIEGIMYDMLMQEYITYITK